MECVAADRLPEGNEGVYELKLDGYRAQGIHDVKGPRLMSRNGKDFSQKYANVLKALGSAIPEGTAVDGELVAVDDAARTSFNALQNAEDDTLVIFFVFDLLRHRGKDLTRLPFSERRTLLNAAFRRSGLVQCSEYFPGPLARFVSGVQAMGGEGVIAKRLSSLYEPGKRSGAWKENAPQHEAGIRDRWLHTWPPRSRCTDRRLLRWQVTRLRRMGACGIGTGCHNRE